MALTPQFKELTGNLRSFLDGITGIDVKYAVRGYPWMYILGKHGQEPNDYFPSFFIIPPSINPSGDPLYGRDLSVTYPVYYVVYVPEVDFSSTNPSEYMEDAMSEVIHAFEDDPQIGMRDFVNYGTYNCSIENDMTFWARDLRQPYVAAKFNFTFSVSMQC
jgi:hypothetical protein